MTIATITLLTSLYDYRNNHVLHLLSCTSSTSLYDYRNYDFVHLSCISYDSLYDYHNNNVVYLLSCTSITIVVQVPRGSALLCPLFPLSCWCFLLSNELHLILIDQDPMFFMIHTVAISIEYMDQSTSGLPLKFILIAGYPITVYV